MPALANLFLLTIYFVSRCVSVDNTQCPNDAFVFVAKQSDLFYLNTDESNKKIYGDRYYIAYGYDGHWTITLVDAKYPGPQATKGATVVGKDQLFKCKAEYWRSAVELADAAKAICCMAKLEIDSNAQTGNPFKYKTHPFAVMPISNYGKFRSLKETPKNGVLTTPRWGFDDEPAELSLDTFHWTLRSHAHLNKLGWKSAEFKVWTITAVDPTFQLRYDAPSPIVVKIPDTTVVCPFSQSKICTTPIISDIAVFLGDCKPGMSRSKKMTMAVFAFSKDGVFNIGTLFHPKCIYNVRYFSIVDFFTVDEQPPPVYSAIGLGWQLGSFCASCPSTAIDIKISEAESKMNKQRLQNALSVGTGAKSPVSVKYTRTWFDEAAETLTSGRATTIKANCNGFYLWYWSVSVGTWGTGSATIPTQAFYCSDRGYPPVCKPQIRKNMGDEFGKICDGHDVAADFGDDAIDNEKPWQSKHDGRPQPIRVQGQREKNGKMEGVLQVQGLIPEKKIRVFKQDPVRRPQNPGIGSAPPLNGDVAKQKAAKQKALDNMDVSVPVPPMEMIVLSGFIGLAIIWTVLAIFMCYFARKYVDIIAEREYEPLEKEA